MAQKNRALIVFGSLVVIGSIGYYLWSKSKKSEGEGSSEPTPDDKPIVGKGTSEPPKPKGEKKQKVKNEQGVSIPHYLEYAEGGVKQFQDWLDTFYPKWLNGKKLSGGKGYGLLGPSTKSAWDSYGKEYDKWLKQQKIISDSTTSQNNLNTIKKNFPNGKSVIATSNFRGYAVMKRNGGWFNTDANGNQLPSRDFKATASLGKVLEVTNDGAVIIQLDVPTTEGIFSPNYYYIRVKPSLIR